MIKKILFSCKNWFVGFYNSNATSHEEQLRQIVYLVSVAMVLFIMPLHFLGLLGMSNTLLQSFTATFILLAVVSFVLLATHVIHLLTALCLLCVGGQVIQSARIIFLTVHPEWGTPEIMTFNLIISYIVLFQLVIGLTPPPPHTPIAITVINILTIAFAHFYNPDGHSLCSAQMWLLFTLLELFTCLMGALSSHTVNHIQEERKEYKTIQDDLLKAFNITQTELVSFLQVWKGSARDETKLLRFMDNLDEMGQERLIRSAHYLESEHKSDKRKIADRFPNLTETELKVAALVIQGKSKHEIAEMLGKTDNNIGTVRVNIRRKLELSTKTDLRTFLMASVK